MTLITRKSSRVHPVNGPAVGPPDDGFSIFAIGPLGVVRLTIEAVREEGILGTLASRLPPQELRERLKAMWTTLGVVSALLAGVALPTVIGGTTTWNSETISMGTKAFVYCIVISFGLSFTVVMMCTMLVVSIDLMPLDDNIRIFVRRFQFMYDGSATIFCVSIVSMVAGCIASIYVNYGWLSFIVLMSYLVSLIVFLGLLFFYIHANNVYTVLNYRRTCRAAESQPTTVQSLAPPKIPTQSSGRSQTSECGIEEVPEEGGAVAVGSVQETGDGTAQSKGCEAASGLLRNAMGVRAGVRLR